MQRVFQAPQAYQISKTCHTEVNSEGIRGHRCTHISINEGRKATNLNQGGTHRGSQPTVKRYPAN